MAEHSPAGPPRASLLGRDEECDSDLRGVVPLLDPMKICAPHVASWMARTLLEPNDLGFEDQKNAEMPKKREVSP